MKTEQRFTTGLMALMLVTGLGAAESAKPAAAAPVAATGLAELLRTTGLTQPQLLSGLKSGLGTAVGLAATELTKPGAWQMPAPPSMAKIESAVKKLNQSGALDTFKASLNQAAVAVAPQTAAALQAAVGNLTLDDASALFSGAPDAATRMLRKAAEPAVRTKLVPYVAQAIAANGTAAKAKDLAAKAGPFAAMMGVPGAADLEGYVLSQVMDTTFGYLAKQEAALRANPAALKDALAKKVFAFGKK